MQRLNSVPITITLCLLGLYEYWNIRIPSHFSTRIFRPGCHAQNYYRRLLVSKFLLNRWRNGWSKWILPLPWPPKIMGYYEKNPFKNRRQVCETALFLISKCMFATPFFSNIFIICLSLAIITAANRCWIPLDPKRYLRILCPLW